MNAPVSITALTPAGPVADRFTKSRAFLDFIMGPVGSAKTTACIQRCVHVALWQNPGHDGVRRARIGVIRDTYPNLDETTIASWHRWFPKHVGQWSGEAPRTHKVTMSLHRPGDVELEMLFIAIGDKRVEDVLRGLELTAAWLNEADRLSPKVLSFLLGRVGRYPGTREGGFAWSGIFGDFNAPDIDNYLYSLLVDLALPEGIDAGEVDFHVQPSGLSPQAENLANLPPRYYERQQIGQGEDYIRRMIRNEWGPVRSGLPVYPEFRDRLHVAARELVPERGVPLILSADAGLTPALTVLQQMPNGQLRVLAELATILTEDDELNGIGPTLFGREVARLLAAPRFKGCEVGEAVADPSSAAGEDGSGHDPSWLKIVSREAGVRFRKAPTNNPTVRIEAVRRPLSRLIEGDQPGLLLDPLHCKVLRKGFNSGYVFRRTQLQGGDGRYENKPTKNQFSHVHDALQYGCCIAGEAQAVIRGERRRSPTVMVESDYDYFGDCA